MRYVFLIVLFISCTESSPSEKTHESVKENHLTATYEPQNVLEYRVANRDERYDEMYVDAVTPSLYSKEQVIEIAHDLRYKSKWTDKLVVRVYKSKFQKGQFYASVAYLPKCRDCGNATDAAGDAVQYLKISR